MLWFTSVACCECKNDRKQAPKEARGWYHTPARSSLCEGVGACFQPYTPARTSNPLGAALGKYELTGSNKSDRPTQPAEMNTLIKEHTTSLMNGLTHPPLGKGHEGERYGILMDMVKGSDEQLEWQPYIECF